MYDNQAYFGLIDRCTSHRRCPPVLAPNLLGANFVPWSIEHSLCRRKTWWRLKRPLEYDIPPNLNGLRQLVSGFGDPSTYKGFRAFMETVASHETLLPATIFTLCDLPRNDNYGISDVAAPKIGSRFLKWPGHSYSTDLRFRNQVFKMHYRFSMPRDQRKLSNGERCAISCKHWSWKLKQTNN
ncbi:uncharacterized protein BYT42DRAFT_617146 [Radiomyces spectabilis]|uniref:uncharacterized protein n=1 Tax=Radiomyces spectabilis TaxID=64574 RepID=UPI00221ED74E|nr:uncharacterized protein BYT42DRAFT_617146 [Radiomyces spectabilis]KAI8370608.1 hypothetical protein BYT42DRAFT_617146 [Radiomyces spectabilis]